jgi:signal transduction histidine kinase
VTRRIVIGVLVTLVGLGAVWAAVVYVLGRDRDAAERELADERLQVLTSAARTFATSLDGIGKDLTLAGALRSDRDLGAMLAVKQQYVACDVRTPDGESTRESSGVAAPVLALAGPVIDSMIETARRAPGELHISPGLSSRDDLPAWYRVFAIKPLDQPVTVACLVDMRLLVTPPDVLRVGPSRLLVMSAHGVPAPASDVDITNALRTEPAGGVLHRLLDAARARDATAVKLDSASARGLGLPDATAVAAAVPVEIDKGTPWVLLVVTSTQTLDARHAALVHRLAIDVAIGLMFIMVAAAYVVRNARRSGELREKLRNAELLAHLTEKAEKILDHVPSGVLALDERDHVSARNRWFGDRDLIGKPLAEVLAGAPLQDTQAVAELIATARRDRRPATVRRTRMALFGGEAYVTLHAIPLDNVFRDVAMLLVIDDESALQRAEDRLLRSEKLATAGQLAAGIAHEIGSPLGVARGRAEMILLRGTADESDAKNLRTIVDRIDHVSRLITQLLDYLRPQASRAQPVDAAQSLRLVAELLQPQASSREVTLDVQGGTATLRADPGQLQQVLVNLVMNAIDACDEGGRVTLSAQPRPGAVVLEVADDGRGIDPEDRALVFDPFFTTKKRGQGTGLGLWVVAQVARAHDAEIELDTTRGTGTTFRIVWPA